MSKYSNTTANMKETEEQLRRRTFCAGKTLIEPRYKTLLELAETHAQKLCKEYIDMMTTQLKMTMDLGENIDSRAGEFFKQFGCTKPGIPPPWEWSLVFTNVKFTDEQLESGLEAYTERLLRNLWIYILMQTLYLINSEFITPGLKVAVHRVNWEYEGNGVYSKRYVFERECPNKNGAVQLQYIPAGNC